MAKKKTRRAYTPAFKEKIVAAYMNGKSGMALSETYTIHPSLVHNWARTNSLPTTKRGKPTSPTSFPYCTHCGTRSKASWNYCGKCGDKI